MPDDELRILDESHIPVPLKIGKKICSTESNRKRREEKMKKISVEKLWQGDDEQEEDQPEVQERSSRQDQPDVE